VRDRILGERSDVPGNWTSQRSDFGLGLHDDGSSSGPLVDDAIGGPYVSRTFLFGD
jgi:hypothetical protein